jgi:hypothetical protein
MNLPTCAKCGTPVAECWPERDIARRATRYIAKCHGETDVVDAYDSITRDFPSDAEVAGFWRPFGRRVPTPFVDLRGVP